MSTITTYDLMLPADASAPLSTWLRQASQDWCYSVKIDGIRCLAVDGRLFTKGGTDITDKFPEIVAPRGMVIDGELAVVNAKGEADFEATARKAKGGHGGPAVLFAFDCLEDDGHDLRGYGYEIREARLSALSSIDTLGVGRLPQYRVGAHDLYDLATEGIVARRIDGLYRAGRHPNLMVRFKKRSTREVIVVGRTPGKGSRASSFGALQCAAVTAGGIMHVGEVGSGFTDRDIVDVLEAFAAGDPFVVEVESLGTTSSGKLRHASFVRLRPDLDPVDVRWSS